MPSLSKAQLLAENTGLRARLSELEHPLLAASPSAAGHRDDETLQSSELRYRRLFESAKDGILILDADSGCITDANPFLQQLLGYSLDELLGKALWDIGPLHDIVASQAAFHELLTREFIRYENLPLETRDGQHRQVEFVSNVYVVAGRKVIQCNVRDISARKQAEADIQLSNEKLSILVTELRRRDHEMQSLNLMNDLLQACTIQAEAVQVLTSMAGDLFPGQGGCLAILHNGDRTLETVAHWGAAELMDARFALDDCWAMRRGHLHVVAEPAVGLACRHFTQPLALGYLCVPLVVQGDTLGVLCLLGLTMAQAQDTNVQQLAVTVGEALKLSVANLKLREALRIQAAHDVLTGLYNRRHLEGALAGELHRAQRSGGTLCVAMLDLDNFKLFNDAYGHEAGDSLLRGLAQLLLTHLRDSDIVCRYGGEEFVLVFPDATLAHTLERVDRLRQLIRTLHTGQALEGVTLSAGVVDAQSHHYEASAILRAADEALYAAKRGGRDRVVSSPVLDQ